MKTKAILLKKKERFDKYKIAMPDMPDSFYEELDKKVKP